MSYEGVADGPYLARQTGLKLKGYPVTHYGIIDIGNTLGVPEIDTRNGPTVIHQTPPRIRFEHMGGDVPWEITDRIADAAGARARIMEGLKTPEYDMFRNNCEHFAKYVAYDNKVSGQVIAGVAVAGGVVALGIAILRKLLQEE